jgi:hypothetical protein
VLQAAGDLGLQHEPLAAGRIIGVIVEDLLEGHLTVQFGVQRDEDSTEAAAGVGAQHAESQPVGGGGADGVARSAVGIVAGLDAGRAQMGERGLDLAIGQANQTLASGTACVQSRQALLHIAAMSLEVPRHQRLDGGAVLVVQVSSRGQVVGQALGPIERPGLERGHELDLVDDAVLEREQSKEEMAVGSHWDPPVDLGRRSEPPTIESCPVDDPMNVPILSR